MHLLYLIDSLDASGGAERSLASLAPIYVEHGIRLDIAYLVERPGLQDALRASGAEVFSLAAPGGRRGWIARAYQLIRRTRPDLVHTTLFESDIAGRIAATLARVPTVSSLVNVEYGPEHLSDASLSRVRMRGAQALDMLTAQSVRRFHAVTGHVASVMARRLALRRGKIDVVPRGRDPRSLGRRTEARRATVRKALELRPDQPMLFVAARHEHQKGLDLLLRAMPSVLRSCPDAALLIAGRKGKATAGLERLVQGSSLQGNVVFLGSRDDVADLLAATDVFVLPSRWEGIAGVLLEAMALEAPIVASDLATLRGIIADQETALLVPPNDPAALSATLVRALTDPGTAASRARRGRREFESRFAIDRVAEEMIAFYDRALFDPSSRGKQR